MKILSRWDNSVIFEDKAKSLKEAVENAVKAKINLSGADLSNSVLSGANLSNSVLFGAKVDDKTVWPNYQICPEEGDFIGFKKTSNNKILRLLIMGARVNSPIGRKCRTQSAKILAVLGDDNQWIEDSNEVFVSKHDSKFEYQIGQIVEVNDFDTDIRTECTHGIHFFMTLKEAKDY